MNPIPTDTRPSLGASATKGAVLCIAGLFLLVFLGPIIVAWAWLLGVAYKAFLIGAGRF